jgi:hypothetical protein
MINYDRATFRQAWWGLADFNIPWQDIFQIQIIQIN